MDFMPFLACHLCVIIPENNLFSPKLTIYVLLMFKLITEP